MQIRPFAYPTDLPAAQALWQLSGPGVRLGRSDTAEEILKKLRHDPDLFLVAENDGRLVGTVIGGYDGRRGLVYHLAVAPAFRNQGIGAALMEAVEAGLRAKGCLRCYLLVVKENQEVVRFYQARGWQTLDNVQLLAKDLG
jgi:ribosomal protein S18 acetylase RimI-like enzyme